MKTLKGMLQASVRRIHQCDSVWEAAAKLKLRGGIEIFVFFPRQKTEKAALKTLKDGLKKVFGIDPEVTAQAVSIHLIRDYHGIEVEVKR